MPIKTASRILEAEHRRQCIQLAATQDADQREHIDTTMANLEAAIRVLGVADARTIAEIETGYSPPPESVAA